MAEKLNLTTKQPNLITPANAYSWFYQLLAKGLKTTKFGGRSWNVERGTGCRQQHPGNGGIHAAADGAIGSWHQ